jgi:hypothetical protein
MKLFLASLISWGVFLVNGYSQSAGKVEIIHDAGVSGLVEKHIQLNEIQKGIPGYRVQIFFASGNNSKPNANRIRAEFLTKYPRLKAYVIYQEPYYKVRVGDFRTRLEAQGILNMISPDFPSSYIVTDEIQYPDLKTNIDNQ